MNRSKHQAVGFQLAQFFGCPVRVVSRVDAPNSLIVVLDLETIPEDAQRRVRALLPNWLSFSLHTYQGLRATANDPNSSAAELLTAAHVLPRSVQLNAFYDLLALEDAAVAQRLQEMLG